MKYLAETGRPSAIGRSSLARYVCLGATRAAAEAPVDLIARIHERRRRLYLSRGEDPELALPPDREKVLAEQFVWGGRSVN